MPPHLAIPDACRRRIVRHARRESPRECCGFLVGQPGHVQSVVEATNLATGTTRYRVDPREHIALRRALRGDPHGACIIGVYHSHPAGPPFPSGTDIAEAHYPDWIHVIVSLAAARARIRAFAIGPGQSREVALTRPGAVVGRA